MWRFFYLALMIKIAGASWLVEVLDPDSSARQGIDNAIAIDSNGKKHISYYDTTNGDLKYATDKSGSWVYLTIDSTGDVGRESSIAIDYMDKVHISYADFDGNILYATDKSGSWESSIIDSGTGGSTFSTSIGINNAYANPSVIISYVKNGDLRRYQNYEIFDANDVVASSTASYYKQGAHNSLYYDSKAWENSFYAIAYYSESKSLKLYIETFEGFGVSTSTSDETILDSSSGYNDVGQYVSLAYDMVGSYTGGFSSTKHAHISFYDAENENLMYVTSRNSYSPKIIDSTGDVGMYSSITVDSNDKVHIVYYDYSNGDLKYATDKSGSWVITTIDSGSLAGMGTSIAMDSNDKVYISYFYAGGSGSLKIATDDTLCTVNQYVSSNKCTYCPFGSTNDAGDDALGGDTTCEVDASPPPPPPPSTSNTPTSTSTGDCECTCCKGNYCSLSSVGFFNAGSSASCSANACRVQFPSSCPSSGSSGSAVSSYSSSSDSSSTNSFEPSSSGTILTGLLGLISASVVAFVLV
jgi:hypothetical protein